jgi:CheY-like chemotaxis protein
MDAQSKLLLIEDNEDDVFLMTRAFKSAAIELPLDVLTDGRQALDYLAGASSSADRGEHRHPAVIFLDIKLPHVSGFEVLRWIRAQPALRRTIVIVLSSSNHPEDVGRAYDLGANSYVTKPASYQQLVDFANGFKAYWLSCNRIPI